MDRAVTETKDILDIMKRCEVVSVAFDNGGTPYSVPLNFGVAEKDGKITLYFHGHKEGTKSALVRANPTVAFSMYTSAKFVENDVPCKCSMKFESVCGTGVASELTGEDKVAAFNTVMKTCFPARDYAITEKMAAVVMLWKIDVTDVVGKKNL